MKTPTQYKNYLKMQELILKTIKIPSFQITGRKSMGPIAKKENRKNHLLSLEQQIIRSAYPLRRLTLHQKIMENLKLEFIQA